MNFSEINKMSKEGMLIGSHSITHNYMSDLTLSEQDNEIKSSFAELEKITNNKTIRVFAFPYGARYTYNSHSLDALDSNHVDIAFTYNDDNENIKTSSNKHYLMNRENPEIFFKK